MLTEQFGLVPCGLCLWQRWPYWVGAAAGLAGAWFGRQAMLGLGVASVLAAGGVGVLHVGVEQGWWPSPLPSCLAANAGGAGMTVEELMRGMAVRPDKPCDEPTYLIPGLPISMAGMNVLYALGLAGLGVMFMARRHREGLLG